MTISHFNDNTDINVYFHMKNHYKKLRNVKSTIDTSAPLGFIKSTSTPPSSDRSWKTCSYEERNTKDCSHLPTHSSSIKKHNCITSDTKSNVSARSVSTPPRPKTRRHPYEMPFRSQWKSRSQSVSVTSRKDVSTEPCNRMKKKRKALSNRISIPEIDSETTKKEIVMNEEAAIDDTNKGISSRKTESSRSEKSISKSRTEEHEYLQFLLRITEDIIINNLYTSEDLEKVFRNHVEANRDRLKMEKMEAQLNRLCKELQIPYKYIESPTNNEEYYPNFFENKHVSRYSHHLENCECATNRELEVDNKDKKINTALTQNGVLENRFDLDNAMFASSLTMLLNKRSLGRVTECTEPTNSTVTLSGSAKQASFTTLSSFENVTVLPCFEYEDTGNVRENNLDESEGVKKESEILDSEIPLTEKEKMGCVEEQIMFDKFTETNSDQFIIKDKLRSEDKTENIKNRVDKGTTPAFVDKNFFELHDIVKEDYIQAHHLKQEDPPLNFDITKHVNENVTKVITDLPKREESVLVKEDEIVSDNTLKFSCDKGVQIEVSRHDKECNTDQKLEGYSINDDYILVNGPVYVLKTALSANENIIFHNNRYMENNEVPKDLTQLPVTIRNALFPPDHREQRLYLIENQFSKLLNSDYDLTPQRDDNASQKYHHLLVDAATSVTNLTTTTVAVSNLNPDTLLLTDNYAINKNEDKIVEDDESEKCHCDQNNSLLFSTNELSSDGQYEIKSYTMPKEVNGCVRLSGYSTAGKVTQRFDQITELDVSLTAYEIKSESSDLGEVKNEVGVSGDGDQLKEIVDVKAVCDENSQLSSAGSEKSQSSISSATYTKNILGKRKLNHPS